VSESTEPQEPGTPPVLALRLNSVATARIEAIMERVPEGMNSGCVTTASGRHGGFRAGIIFVAATLLPAQSVPRIAIIDFYGLNRVPESRVRQVLGVKEGDQLPPSKGGTEERLDSITGVVESHLEAVCCEAGNAILYVGIEERGATHFDLR
jgi:hypothetical protein